MQICQEHWERLRQAIRERGLEPFVATSAEDAAARLMESVDSENPYDPLIAANMTIITRAAQIEPTLLLRECCPLCEVEAAAGAGSAQNWINGCTDMILADFREHGWVAPPN